MHSIWQLQVGSCSSEHHLLQNSAPSSAWTSHMQMAHNGSSLHNILDSLHVYEIDAKRGLFGLADELIVERCSREVESMAIVLLAEL